MQSSASARALTDDLKRHASSMGIDLVGCTSASPFLLGEERRQIDPRDTMPEARSIVVAACYVYGFEVHEPSEPGRPRGKFGPWTRASVAAAGYGERTIAEFLEARGYRVASPGNLPRKAAAVRAGIACYGKNSIVHADGFGSYLKLSAVLTDAELACVDGPIEVSDCGDCDACVRACPTGALAQPYRLAREKCICTWMWGDPIAADARAAVGAYIFRCGYCQDACPKNDGLTPRAGFPFELEAKPDCPELIPLVLGDERCYRSTLPEFILQAGVDTIRRNVIIATGNSGDPAAVPVLIDALSLPHPQTRAAAAWALGRLGGSAASAALRSRLPDEQDAAVREEIGQALRALA
jgi:epoxyqueuosine reductase